MQEEVCKDEFKEVEETVYERVCGQSYTKVEIPYSQRVKRHGHDNEEGAVDSYGAPVAPPHTIDSYGPPAAPLLPPQPCQTNDLR